MDLKFLLSCNGVSRLAILDSTLHCDTVYLVFKAVWPNYHMESYAISPASPVPSMSSPVTVSVVFVTVEAIIRPVSRFIPSTPSIFDLTWRSGFVYPKHMCGVSSLPGLSSFIVMDMSFSDSPQSSLAYESLHYYSCLASICTLAHIVLTALRLPSASACNLSFVVALPSHSSSIPLIFTGSLLGKVLLSMSVTFLSTLILFCALLLALAWLALNRYVKWILWPL